MRSYARHGNEAIFQDVLPKLKALFNETTPLKGEQAKAWDMRTLAEEQRLVQPMYGEMSKQSIQMWSNAAKQTKVLGMLGMIAYGLSSTPAFPKSANLLSPSDRWAYGMSAMGYHVQPSDMASVPVGDAYLNGSAYAGVKNW